MSASSPKLIEHGSFKRLTLTCELGLKATCRVACIQKLWPNIHCGWMSRKNVFWARIKRSAFSRHN
ncbi:lasso RiPP family leader peptide-containing protein [Pelagibaculum spongiae]|uniref:lasso RiPP family leader peptide-containing protein n=1 Tax=Pelagibaculum spongiae TaxID=2080658 RepID=UPI0034E1BCC5